MCFVFILYEYVEAVGICQRRECRAGVVEGGFAYGCGDGLRNPIPCLGNGTSGVVDYGTVADVVCVVRCRSVGGYYVALVLYGAGSCQYVPCGHTFCRPLCWQYYRVVVLAAACPYREAQVVARKKKETHPCVLDYYTAVAINVFAVFAAVGEKVALVVIRSRAVRLYEVVPVAQESV